MLASTVEASLVAGRTSCPGPGYDGVPNARPGCARPACAVGALWSHARDDKPARFPAIVEALQRYAFRLHEPVLLDGEVVALDAHGEPVGFRHLQSRIGASTSALPDDGPSTFSRFDLVAR